MHLLQSYGAIYVPSIMAVAAIVFEIQGKMLS